jgi:hypothetical protein
MLKGKHGRDGSTSLTTALGSPSGHAHRIRTQLHNHAVLLPVVNKGTETDELERRDRALQRISV